jgi:uncharacterized protein (TIGR02145 family)
MTTKITSVLSLLFLFAGISLAQTTSLPSLTANNPDGSMTRVLIGRQVWTKVNLDVSTFANGDPILEAKTPGEWKAVEDKKQPAWCYYNNDSSNGRKYGKLYNWFAVNDPRGLCPTGWHIPSDQEWAILTDVLGGADKAGASLKGDFGWDDLGGKSVKGGNDSGFAGFPGGYRKGNNKDGGAFSGLGYNGIWWSSTTTDLVWEGERLRSRFRNWTLNYISDGMVATYSSEDVGLSVRCVLGNQKNESNSRVKK